MSAKCLWARVNEFLWTTLWSLLKFQRQILKTQTNMETKKQ